MNALAPLTITVDRDLPRPQWMRRYDPVDLLMVFLSPDNVERTLHAGVFQTIEDAREQAGITDWLPADAKGKKRSVDGKWIIQPVST